MRHAPRDAAVVAPRCPDCHDDGVLTIDGDIVCRSCGADLVRPVLEASRRRQSPRLAPPAD